MRTLLSTLLLLATTTGCKTPQAPTPPTDVAAAPEARPEREPVVRLSEHDGWGGGSTGVPEFTLYADGLVLFVRGEGPEATVMQAWLSKDETYALLDRANEALGELPETTWLTEGTDQPTSSIGVSHEGRIYRVSMYGFGVAETPAPAAFTALRDTLAEWDHADAEPWTPDELVISMFRTDEAPNETWPEALPLPPSSARVPRERVLGREGATVPQPIRYRVAGTLETALRGVVPPLYTDRAAPAADALYAKAVEWNGASWLVRYDRVVPAETWFW